MGSVGSHVFMVPPKLELSIGEFPLVAGTRVPKLHGERANQTHTRDF